MGEIPELFYLLEKYLKYLEKPDSDMFFGFWLFCIRFAGFLGYEIDLKHCKRCGKKIGGEGKANFSFLSNQNGGFLCGDCRSKPNLNGEILQILSKGSANISEKLQVFPKKEKIFITEQLISYIQFHCGKDKPLNSFKFFCDCTAL
jgi:recombinational DNA repair protein (RecF pathway)